MRARRRSATRPSRPAAVAALLFGAFAAAAQARQSMEPGPSGAAPPPSRDYGSALAAELESASQKGPAELSRLLEARASGLPPGGAAALLLDFAPWLSDPALARRFLAQAGGIALIARDYPLAAKAYEAAAGADLAGEGAAYLASAARAWLASGERDPALALALRLEPGQPLAAALVRVWAFLLAGEASAARAALSSPPLAQAAASAAPVAGVGQAPLERGHRREALFLAWLLAAPPARGAIAGALGREFPSTAEALVAAAGSLEAAMRSGSKVSLPALPHWYLAGLPAIAAATAASPPAAPGATGRPLADAGGAAGDPEASVPKKLQIGAFSLRENAERLAAELRSKGFSPSIETGQGRSGTVHAVTVPPGKDANATLLRLKDAGYEAYPLY